MRAKLILSFVAAALGASAAVAQVVSDDPYIWLEEVASPKAMSACTP